MAETPQAPSPAGLLSELTVDFDADPPTMSGVERWTWTGPGGSRPNSLATVTGFRVG